MHLATFDNDRLGLVIDDRIVDVSDVVGGDEGLSRMRRHIMNPRPAAIIAARGRGPSYSLDEVTLRPPVPDPQAIVAAPVNYADHQAEMKEKADVGSLGFFLKAPSSVIGDKGTVHLPYSDRRFDHEAEIAVVIGRQAHDVAEDEIFDYIFGYMGLIDITMRGGEDRSNRKSFDTFTPCGPWIVTKDELDPADIDFSLTTNGELRQKSNTANLIWSVSRFVSYVSTVVTLRPGDIITTGTPAGVSPLRHGDTVSLRAEGIGTLTVHVDGSRDKLSTTTGHNSGPKPPPS